MVTGVATGTRDPGPAPLLLDALMPNRVCGFCLVAIAAFCARGACGYEFHSGNASSARWTSTSVQGSTGAVGRPARLSWSIVPDGTQTIDDVTTNGTGPSDLHADFNAAFGAVDWQDLLDQAFERWEALSGLTFTREANDNGVAHNGGFSSGAVGVRGDIRMSGIGIDGAGGSNNTLAYSFFPNFGDQALDTDDVGYFTGTANNYRALRNTVMHELGHGLGLEHVSSTGSKFLMETNIDLTFDGPQHDDLLGIHAMYGDQYEKTNSGQGNEVYTNATDLGALAAGGSLAVGTSGSGVVIGGDEVDFVSIANSQDRDFFAFSVSESVRLDITLTPRGATYSQGGSTLNTLDDNNLSLTLFDQNGTSVLSFAGSLGAGLAETIDNFLLDEAGEYYLRVLGSTNAVQLYQLDLMAESVVPSLLGDYNLDGMVDAADYTVYRDTFGITVGAYQGADGDGDGEIGPGDYAVWAGAYGSTNSNATAVPETGGVLLLTTAIFFLATRRSTSYFYK